MNVTKFGSNIPSNYQHMDQAKDVYSGVTTRKRAALKAVNKANKNNFNIVPKIPMVKQETRNHISNKENSCDNFLKLSDSETDKAKSYNDLVNEPFVWPKCVELNDKIVLRNLFKTYQERREIIRAFYTNKITSETPLWYPSASNDEFMHIDYLPLIVDHLIEKEEFYEPLGLYFLDSSIDINYRHRYTLVDWMVQVHEQLVMSNECLQLSIALMDRFIKSLKAQLKREDVQIIGIMCLFIAAKFEEVFTYTLVEFLDEVKVKYDVGKCRLLEERILATVDFKLSIPLPLAFVRHYNLMFKAETIAQFYSRYFCELSLHDYLASGYSSNMIGASCVFLAQVICQKVVDNFGDTWSGPLQCCSGLLYTDFIDLVKNLCVIVSKQQTPSKYRAIAIKYSADNYRAVAKTVTQTVGFKHILGHFKTSMAQ